MCGVEEFLDGAHWKDAGFPKVYCGKRIISCPLEEMMVVMVVVFRIGGEERIKGKKREENQ